MFRSSAPRPPRLSTRPHEPRASETPINQPRTVTLAWATQPAHRTTLRYVPRQPRACNTCIPIPPQEGKSVSRTPTSASPSQLVPNSSTLLHLRPDRGRRRAPLAAPLPARRSAAVARWPPRRRRLAPRSRMPHLVVDGRIQVLIVLVVAARGERVPVRVVVAMAVMLWSKVGLREERAEEGRARGVAACTRHCHCPAATRDPSKTREDRTTAISL